MISHFELMPYEPFPTNPKKVFEFVFTWQPVEFYIALMYDVKEKYSLDCRNAFGEKFSLELSDAEGEKLLNLVSDAKISALPESLDGLDGNHFEMRIVRGQNYAVYHWWGKCPKNWKPFCEVAKILMAKTRHHFKDTFGDWVPYL